MRAILAILCALVSWAAAAGQTPGFWLVGIAPGTESSATTGLSADGRIACGASGFGVGFTWTREGGRDDFGLQPGMPWSNTPLGLSSDGGTLAGVMYATPSSYLLSRAYRRVGNGPLVDLGVMPGYTRSYSRGMSGDGGTVVGACEWGQATGLNGQAFRWTQQGGMQGLGFVRPGSEFSRAMAISRDGGTIVGESHWDGISDGFVWREGAGMVGLPRLPGVPADSWTRAGAVSADGSVIVGDGDSPATGTSTALRWTAAGVQDLGSLPGYLRSVAHTVDGSGDVVCGIVYTGLPTTVFVWTPQTGMKLLADHLASYGVSVPAGYRLNQVYAISEDGLTFAGDVVNLSTGRGEGFVATVPSPATAPVMLLLPALRRRRRLSAA